MYEHEKGMDTSNLPPPRGRCSHGSSTSGSSQLSDGARNRSPAAPSSASAGTTAVSSGIQLDDGGSTTRVARARTLRLLLPGHEIAAHERVVERREGTVVAERAVPSAARSHADGPRTAREAPGRPRPRSTSCSRTRAREDADRAARVRPAVADRHRSRRRASSPSGSGGASTPRSGSCARPSRARVNIHRLARSTTVPGEPMPSRSPPRSTRRRPALSRHRANVATLPVVLIERGLHRLVLLDHYLQRRGAATTSSRSGIT